LHLLGARPVAARTDAGAAADERAGEARQIEMPLRAAGG
jgi:hypothetical protein